VRDASDTLASPRRILATWAIADTAMLADMMATCLFFVPPERLTSFDFRYAVIYEDRSLRYSPDLPIELY
jgi:thiamine biosynthesis lipoprotein